MMPALEQLKKLEPTYAPNPHTAEQISDKHLVAFIGAFGVGKTTLMKCIDTRHPNYSEAVTLTSQPPGDSSDTYRFIEHTEENIADVLRRAAAGELVNLSVHPTTDYVYCTEPQDYKTRTCMFGPTAKSFGSDKQLPFAKITPVVVVVEPEPWVNKRLATHDHDEQDARNRIIEARQSIVWSLEQHDVVFVNNTSPDITLTADRLVRTIEGAVEPDPRARMVAQRMLQATFGLLP